MGQQAIAEFGAHRVMEAPVGQLQAEQILPIDPPADGLGGLAIREIFEELQDQDQGQAGRGRGGLAAAGEQVGKLRIGVDGAQFVGEPQAEIALRQDGAGDLGGLVGD